VKISAKSSAERTSGDPSLSRVNEIPLVRNSPARRTRRKIVVAMVISSTALSSHVNQSEGGFLTRLEVVATHRQHRATDGVGPENVTILITYR
jgi:hypothetical protein